MFNSLGRTIILIALRPKKITVGCRLLEGLELSRSGAARLSPWQSGRRSRSDVGLHLQRDIQTPQLAFWTAQVKPDRWGWQVNWGWQDNCVSYFLLRILLVHFIFNSKASFILFCSEIRGESPMKSFVILVCQQIAVNLLKKSTEFSLECVDIVSVVACCLFYTIIFTLPPHFPYLRWMLFSHSYHAHTTCLSPHQQPNFTPHS